MNLLVAYATTDGMTGRIAERIADTARNLGHRTVVADVAHLPAGFDPSMFDAILLGASMHAQGYQRAASRFVREHLELLRAQPSGFFSVSLSIRSKNPEEQAASRRIAEHFPQARGWKPAVVESIAGALMFSRYGALTRWMMRRIAEHETGEAVDTSQDTIFTDWNAVDRFTRSFLELASRRIPAGRPSIEPSSPSPLA